MAKRHSLNLLIFQSGENRYVQVLKKILPITAGISFLAFIAIFVLSVFYVNKNTKEFNVLKNEVEALEKKIADQKNTEGIYTLTVMRLNALSQILSQEKNFSRFLSEVDSLQSGNIEIDSATIDKKGLVSMSLIASSSAALDDFVTLLLDKDREKLYTDITAGGISREKKGNYKLTLGFKASSLLTK